MSGGSLSGNPGTYSGASFTPNGSPVSINIDAGASLSDVRDAINSANAGVAASLIFDGSQYRLSLSSTSTGLNSSFSLNASGDATLSSLLNQDPSGSQAFQETQTATDLSATLNGIPVTNSTNILDKTVSGLSITAYGTGLATLNVAQNVGAAAAAVSGFIAAWNGLGGIIKALTSFDPSTKIAGPLLGDPLAGSAFNSLTSATFGYAAPASANLVYNTLASLGITVDSKGVASVDNAKLGTALKTDPQALAKLFSSSKGNILGNANAYVTNIIGGAGIGGRTTALNQQVTQNQKQQDAWNSRLVLIRKNLTAQYTALDASVAKFQSISSFLGNQIAQFNKSSG
jgi:flagellar hook-associated protein 2